MLPIPVDRIGVGKTSDMNKKNIKIACVDKSFNIAAMTNNHILSENENIFRK